jgi:hypothetical protein
MEDQMAKSTVAPSTDSVIISPRKTWVDPTAEEMDRALQLRDLKVVWKNSLNKKVRTYRVEGKKYRFYAGYRVAPARGTITVILRVGATWLDYAVAKAELEEMLSGYYNRYPWDEYDDKENPGEKFSSLSLGMTNKFFKTRTFENPRSGKSIYICNIKGCKEYGKPHEIESIEDPCVIHEGERAESKGGEYKVTMERFDSEPWKLEVWVGEDLTPALAHSLSNDITWLAREVEALERWREEKRTADALKAKEAA